MVTKYIEKSRKVKEDLKKNKFKDSMLSKKDPGHVGTLIKNIRKKKGINQIELAKLINTTQQNLSQIEKGNIKYSRYFPLIEKALDLPDGYLTAEYRDLLCAPHAFLSRYPVISWDKNKDNKINYITNFMVSPKSFLLKTNDFFLKNKKTKIYDIKKTLDTYILVDPMIEPSNGDYVIASKNNNLYYRQYIIDGDSKYYVSTINPDDKSTDLKLQGTVLLSFNILK